MSNALTTLSFQPVEKRMAELGMDVVQIKKEISFALQHINKNTRLKECTGESILAAVVNIANIGLTLNPAAKESYLVPRYNSQLRGNECCLEPSYVGLVKLLTDAGSVKSVLANLVYEKDFFELDLANNIKPITHRPVLSKENRGKIIGVYALATLPDDNRQVEWIEISDVYEIRNRSESYKAFKAGKVQSCVWATDEGEMIRKTVVKRIYKYLPRTDRMEKIDKAINLDNKDFIAEDWQIDKINELLESGIVDRTEKGMIEIELPTMSKTRAYDVINKLSGYMPNNALDNAKFGKTLSAKEAAEAVKQSADA